MIGLVVELLLMIFTSPAKGGSNKVSLEEQGDNFTYEGRVRNRSKV